MSEEIAKEEAEGEARDIAEWLTKYVTEGDTLDLSAVYTMLGGAANSHLFELSEKRAREKLISILRSGKCCSDKYYFEYRYQAEGRAKHHVKVTPISEFLG